MMGHNLISLTQSLYTGITEFSSSHVQLSPAFLRGASPVHQASTFFDRHHVLSESYPCESCKELRRESHPCPRSRTRVQALCESYLTSYLIMGQRGMFHRIQLIS